MVNTFSFNYLTSNLGFFKAINVIRRANGCQEKILVFYRRVKIKLNNYIDSPGILNKKGLILS